MVHVFAAVGAEAGDYGAGRAFGGGGMSACFRANHRLSPFGSQALAAFCDFAQGAADAKSLVDGGSRAPAQAAQDEAFGAECVVHRASTGTAGAAGRVDFVAWIAIWANVHAVEPRRVEEFSGLHVESNSDRVFLALGVG